MSYHSALILGAGAFGTSMASVLANKFKVVILKVRREELYQQLLKGENDLYLPGQKLPANIVPALTWEEVFEKVHDRIDLLVSGLPTHAIDPFMDEHASVISDLLKKGVPFISLSKGINSESLEMADDLYGRFLGPFKEQLCFLSGPSFAREIVEQQITLVSLAGSSLQTLEKAAAMLEARYFKVFPTYDIKGVLLGGALKNILAIAGGLIEGLGYNHNTRAALITKGIEEMLRFGKVFNARPETFYGLSGMGDLILTTTGGMSRNKQFGIELAMGRSPQEILDRTHYVVEGYKTTKAVHYMADKYQIRARIFNGMYEILYEGKNPRNILEEFMQLSGKMS